MSRPLPPQPHRLPHLIRALSSCFTLRLVSWFLRLALPVLLLGFPTAARAKPTDFALPAQPAAEALLEFSKQARIEVLYSFDQLRKVTANAVTGRLEPEDALNRLLKGTGFAARRNERGKFVVTAISKSTGAIRGRLLGPDGTPAPSLRVVLAGTRLVVAPDESGAFEFPAVPPGTYELVATGPGCRQLQLSGVRVEADHVRVLEPRTLQSADTLTQLETYIVEGESVRRAPLNRAELAPRMAIGNLDLPRTENDALPYKIYGREKIAGSGVVDLNQFLQRELLDSDATTRSIDQNGQLSSFLAGSTNLNLRGFGSESTIILINGRRMPESAATETGRLGSPDVNFIPLSLVQQVEVLPVSASALYTGNPVGGVINIVLRPDVNATELTTTYTNALGGYDAPQSSVSLQHGQTLLDGRLHLRANATFTRTLPPTESELGYRQATLKPPASLGDSLYRATPNVRSATLTPLFGAGTSPVTSVAPGADGTGGLAAFAGRAGMRNLALFDSPGGLAASLESIDQPYGRRQTREAYFASAVYDVFPSLQVGFDGVYTHTAANRGYDVFATDLTLAAASPFNPFGQDVIVSLNETAPQLGENYSKAQLDLYSLVAGLLVKLPADWRVALDGQFTRNVVRYRGLAGVDHDRWQQLVDSGVYNPLRDTQRFGPPPEFYDRVLTYFGRKDQFTTLGDYNTFDAAIRFTNQSLAVPTGIATVALGTDYRRTQLEDYSSETRFADGSLAEPVVEWKGRTLERLSAFGEFQAPLFPAARLPRWLRNIETDLAVRYVASSIAKESNVAPTYGLKIDFSGGLSARASFTTASRYPVSAMSHAIYSGGGGGGPGVTYAEIYDPARGNERYLVIVTEDRNPNIATESAVTQTAGLIFQRGETHRIRLALDFVDTRKTNELFFLTPQDVINLDALFPGRITRGPLASGDSAATGRITELVTGLVNASWRRSQNWNLALDYAWNQCFGGTLELYGRLVYFQRFDLQLLASLPVVDELSAPDLNGPQLLPWRGNFGASWSTHDYGFGFDGHYYDARMLPAGDWPIQGSRQIDAHWQYDVHLRRDLGRWLLGRWLLGRNSRYGLSAQLRINNIFDTAFPRYATSSSGSGVQAYGDWRGRTYSFSLTATF